VVKGLAAAKRAGLDPVKVNTVLMRGVNDDEAGDLLAWALDEGYALRFIEQMPLDPQHGWDRTTMLDADEILARLGERWTLTPVEVRGSAPAGAVPGGRRPATVGVVGSVSRPFCGACDRLRLTADGRCATACSPATSPTCGRRCGPARPTTSWPRSCGPPWPARRRATGIGEPGFVQPGPADVRHRRLTARSSPCARTRELQQEIRGSAQPELLDDTPRSVEARAAAARPAGEQWRPQPGAGWTVHHVLPTSRRRSWSAARMGLRFLRHRGIGRAWTRGVSWRPPRRTARRPGAPRALVLRAPASRCRRR
jgi:hypothetical protein